MCIQQTWSTFSEVKIRRNVLEYQYKYMYPAQIYSCSWVLFHEYEDEYRKMYEYECKYKNEY